MQTVCRFEFKKEMDREEVEVRVALAILAAERVFGKPKVRISAGYLISEDGSQAVVDVSTQVGEFVAEIFTGMLIKRLGDTGFVVDRAYGEQAGQKEGGAHARKE